MLAPSHEQRSTRHHPGRAVAAWPAQRNAAPGRAIGPSRPEESARRSSAPAPRYRSDGGLESRRFLRFTPFVARCIASGTRRFARMLRLLRRPLLQVAVGVLLL